MQSLIVWKDRANVTKIQLSKNGLALTAEEMDLITSVEIRYNGSYYNSGDYPNVFDFATYKESGIIALKMGLLPISAGSDIVEVITYDAVNTDGIVWLQLSVEVKDDALKA